MDVDSVKKIIQDFFQENTVTIVGIRKKTSNFCLMDKKLVVVEGGLKKFEALGLFTVDTRPKSEAAHTTDCI